jgi:hypothetical protein
MEQPLIRDDFATHIIFCHFLIASLSIDRRPSHAPQQKYVIATPSFAGSFSDELLASARQKHIVTPTPRAATAGSIKFVFARSNCSAAAGQAKSVPQSTVCKERS